MVKFKGCSSIKQYIPQKPIKRGYKIWSRAEQSGFLYQFNIYTGKEKEASEKNLGERVVKTLCEPLYSKNHVVYMDNFLSSYNLYKFLESKSIYAYGTVNMMRKNLPKQLSHTKLLKKGDFDYAICNDNIVCLKWEDNRSVPTILSALENPTNLCKVERKNKDGTKKRN